MRVRAKMVLSIAAASFASSRFADAQYYAVTSDVPIPLNSYDGVSTANTVNYTSLAIGTTGGSVAPQESPNGTTISNGNLIVGTLTGKGTATANSNAAETTAFAYDPTNGFRLIGTYSLNIAGGHASGTSGAINVKAVNANNQVIGNTTRNSTASSTGGILGQDAWLYNTSGGANVTVGLIGTSANLSYNTAVGTTVGTFSYNSADFLNDSGTIVGNAGRYDGSTATYPYVSAGKSVWIQPAGQAAAEIGLFGTGYSYMTNASNGSARYSSNTDVGLNAAGQVIGNASNYYDKGNGTGTALGQDGWIYSAAPATAVGMYQSGLTAPAMSTYTTAYSQNVTTGGTTSPYRSTTLTTLNAGGFVAGSSQYYNTSGTSTSSLGTTAFVYNSSNGSYKTVGLTTGSAVTYYGDTAFGPAGTSQAGKASSTISAINNTGATAGTSSMYTPTGGQAGTVAWYANPSGVTTFINPTTAANTPPANGSLFTSVTNLTNSGFVGGYTAKYSGTTQYGNLGYDAFVYDANKNTTYVVGPASETSSSYAYDMIQYISEDGYAVGSYETSAGGQQQAFIWSESGGFVSLGNVVIPTSLSAAGYQTLVQSWELSSGTSSIYTTALNSQAATSAGPGYSYTGLVSLQPVANLTFNNAGGSGDGVTWSTAQQNFNNGTGLVAFSNGTGGTGDIVTFNDTNNGNYNVSIPAAVTPSSTVVNNSLATYNFNGSGGIGGVGSLTKLGTSSLVLGTINTYTGGTNVSGGSVILAVAGALPSGTNLAIGSGASVVASKLGSPVALTVGSLSIAGQLDLNNNAVIVHNSSIGAVTALVSSGFNGGAWNGATGIISTSAANDPSHLTALGVIQNSTDGTTSGAVLHSTVEGQPAINTDVLVRYTYYGDANLDGIVDGTDYSRIDSSFLSEMTGPSVTGWFNGDFNYDNVVDGSDYTLIDNAFNSQGVQLTDQIAAPTAQIAGGAAVPEPTTLGLFGICAVGLLGRRRAVRRHD